MGGRPSKAWTPAAMPDLSDKTVVITGANHGIGYYTALEMARKGANVVIGCRSDAKGIKAVEQIKETLPDAKLEYIHLDLADLDSTQKFAKELLKRRRRIDILVNNAGVMALPERSFNKDGVDMQIAINHVGHFALTKHLMDRLKASSARVVNVSSMIARVGSLDFNDISSKKSPYDRWKMYARSKYANLCFTAELNNREKEIEAITTHPGYSTTGLQKFVPLRNFLKVFAQSAEQGAWTTLYAATLDHVDRDKLMVVAPDGQLEFQGHPYLSSHFKLKEPSDPQRLWEWTDAVVAVHK